MGRRGDSDCTLGPHPTCNGGVLPALAPSRFTDLSSSPVSAAAEYSAGPGPIIPGIPMPALQPVRNYHTEKILKDDQMI